jgi:hypothetical protein
MLILYVYNKFFVLSFFFFHKAHTHMQTHVHTYTDYSNDFNLRKFWVRQDLHDWNDCLSWGTSVLSYRAYRINV